MNTLILRPVALGLVVALASLPLHAQTAAPATTQPVETVATVETEGGVIMISKKGEEFLTAVPEQRVRPSARLMVSEGSSATVVYDDGCKQVYDKPGIYAISENCSLPVALVAAPETAGWVLAATVVGGGLIALAIAENHDNDDGDARQPVSR